MNVATSMTLPSAAYASTPVGCASAAMSGGLPPSMRVLSTVSWLEPMLSTWIVMPVAAWKSLIAARSLRPRRRSTASGSRPSCRRTACQRRGPCPARCSRWASPGRRRRRHRRSPPGIAPGRCRHRRRAPWRPLPALPAALPSDFGSCLSSVRGRTSPTRIASTDRHASRIRFGTVHHLSSDLACLLSLSM